MLQLPKIRIHKANHYNPCRFHFLRELTKDGIIELIHCSTKEQLSDIMTKPLKLETFLKLREKLEMCGLASIN